MPPVVKRTAQTKTTQDVHRYQVEVFNLALQKVARANWCITNAIFRSSFRDERTDSRGLVELANWRNFISNGLEISRIYGVFRQEELIHQADVAALSREEVTCR